MGKAIESIVARVIIKWSKAKTIKISLALFTMLILIGYGATIEKSIVTLAIFPVITLFVIFYVRTFGRIEAEQEFAKYRHKWNSTFGDNSFDTYFTLDNYFDLFFESDFLFEMNMRLLKMAAQKTSKKGYYDSSSQKYVYPKDITVALKYFGYNSLKEIKLDTLKKEYHKRLRIVHPDNGGTPAAAEELIKNYNVLKEAI